MHLSTAATEHIPGISFCPFNNQQLSVATFQNFLHKENAWTTDEVSIDYHRVWCTISDEKRMHIGINLR